MGSFREKMLSQASVKASGVIWSPRSSTERVTNSSSVMAPVSKGSLSCAS